MLTADAAVTPYCGPPPVPADLLLSWNSDPVVITVLLLAGAAFLWRAPASGAGRRLAEAGALAMLAVAFISPLCALSSALFSARIAHHLLLISVAAPLLAVAIPARRASGAAGLVLALVLHVTTVWFWHAPAPYAAAMADPVTYWVMEGSLLGTAFLAWRALLAPGAPPLRNVFAHVAFIALMGLLGALITFAPVPLYAPHAASTAAFGLTPLEDQQLAGLLMWVPAALPNLVAGLLCLRRLVADAAGAEAARA